MGENFLASIPTAVYGTSLLMPAIPYHLLQKAIVRRQGTHSVLANALGGDFKGSHAQLALFFVAHAEHDALGFEKFRPAPTPPYGEQPRNHRAPNGESRASQPAYVTRSFPSFSWRPSSTFSALNRGVI